MNAEQIISLIVAVLTGLATCVPLAYKLVEYVKKATQEKNWAALLGAGSQSDGRSGTEVFRWRNP